MLSLLQTNAPLQCYAGGRTAGQGMLKLHTGLSH
jgi:hypothetical protein